MKEGIFLHAGNEIEKHFGAYFPRPPLVAHERG
jgi:hypothetical protein